MDTTALSGGLTVHLQRRLSATPLIVFRMHTEPELFARWWGPEGFSVPEVELDVRVGGSFRVAMQPPEGDRFHLAGEFREVEPGRGLAYTFRWEEPDPDDRETLVVLSLRADGESTELTVDHGVFLNERRRALHDEGWTQTLDRLEAFVAGKEWARVS